MALPVGAEGSGDGRHEPGDQEASKESGKDALHAEPPGYCSPNYSSQ